MKDKIIFLIIGILIGAIIATAGFLVYNKSITSNSNQSEIMQPNGNGQMGEPPSNGNMGQSLNRQDENNGEEPPEKPENSNNNSNS